VASSGTALYIVGMKRLSRIGLLLLACMTFALLVAGCGSSASNGANRASGFDAGRPGSGDGGTGSDAGGFDATYIVEPDGGSIVGDDSSSSPPPGGPIAIAPTDQTIDVNYGDDTPTVAYSATVNGAPVGASFQVDRGEIASIDPASGVLTPTGTIGGVVNITASYQGAVATTQLIVRVHLVDNGAEPADGGTAEGGGAGGNGGVGGEGQGGPVDPGTQTALQGTPTADPGLAWLYPYDQTVWPQGLLAPLLQWSAPQNYDAVFIHLQEDAFEYQGYFAATATPFVHHPIPQAAWDALSNSNAGEAVTVTLVFDVGGQPFGPLTETWNIAQGRLEGTVYYQSYGTALAMNFCCVYGSATQEFGGATLAIRHGLTDPVLVAGDNTTCRVCHSVSANGSRLVTQDGTNSNYESSWTYDLVAATPGTALMPADNRFAWSALYPDGTFLLTDGAPLDPNDKKGWSPAELFSLPGGAALASTGLPATLEPGTPAFSPDGTHVAFNYYAGAAQDGGPPGDGVSLAVMDFDQTTDTFSNLQVLFTPPSGTAVWPSFLPTNDAVVFELETVNNGRDWGGTRSGCDNSGVCSNSGTQAELWWVDLATKTPVRLDNLNGLGYAPSLASTQHTNDSTLNYEPTVNPVPSGGYAWVVFTSRRLYGNIATINPWWSDPRYHDISTTPTTKKLWVAAFDLNATPGIDPSHPAFYLPAQELLAGNSRGFWVVNPCLADGSSCQTGDQCCGGYCRNIDGGLICSAQPPACSNEFDKCATSADCCGSFAGLACINGRCAQEGPPK